jgi:hypothetical protein
VKTERKMPAFLHFINSAFQSAMGGQDIDQAPKYPLSAPWQFKQIRHVKQGKEKGAAQHEPLLSILLRESYARKPRPFYFPTK